MCAKGVKFHIISENNIIMNIVILSLVIAAVHTQNTDDEDLITETSGDFGTYDNIESSGDFDEVTAVLSQPVSDRRSSFIIRQNGNSSKHKCLSNLYSKIFEKKIILNGKNSFKTLNRV